MSRDATLVETSTQGPEGVRAALRASMVRADAGGGTAMGFFGLFGKKNALGKHAERVANKRAQAPDRWESIQALGKIATTGEPAERSQAVAALLERFTFYVDPTITDGEEKD